MPFETPAGFAGEVKAGLSNCGQDDDDLVGQLQNNGINTWLTPGAKMALNFISGWEWN